MATEAKIASAAPAPIHTGVVPPGPAEKYDLSDEILPWLMRNFKQFGGIYRASMYGGNVYVVSEPQYVDHVMRENWQNYKKGQAIERVRMLLGNGLMVSEGQLWKKQRKMIQPAFHPEIAGSMLKMLADSSQRLLESWLARARNGQAINVTREVSLWVLEVVLRSIFGQDYDRVAPEFNILSSESTRNMQFAQIFRPLREVVRNLVNERRQNRNIAEDILGMLMEARDRTTGEAMPDGQLLSEIVTLVVAGHETTAGTLSWFWYLVSQHPKVEAKLAREISAQAPFVPDSLNAFAAFPYTRQVIEETMRLYPPGWLLTRRAIQDDQLGDYFVPAGTEVYISLYLIQRNPALWENPDIFDPDRFAPERIQNRHPLATFPFSAGPRKCVGEFLARVEMQIHIITIASHLRLHHISGDPRDLETEVNLRCKNDFLFTPQLRRRRAA